MDRLRARLLSSVLARLCGSGIPHLTGHPPLTLGLRRIYRLPEIHPRTRYFKALVRIEDSLDGLGTAHVHNPQTGRMTTLIPQNLRERYRSKRGEGLTERVTGAKVR